MDIAKKAQLYDLSLEISNDGVYDWDVVLNKIRFDPIYYTMAGYDVDEFPGHFDEWKKRVHPDDQEHVLKHASDYLNGIIKVYDVEFRFLKKDLSWMWIRARVKKISRNHLGEPTRIVGTHTDITDRKIVEFKLEKEYLRESQENSFMKTKENALLKQQLRDQAQLIDELNQTIHNKNDIFEQACRNCEKEKNVQTKAYYSQIQSLVLPLLEELKFKYPPERPIIDATLESIYKISASNFKNLPQGLTKRENQIYHLSQLNKSSKDIAQELSLSPATVERHRHNINKKLKKINKDELK